jgi:hypothetical protein
MDGEKMSWVKLRSKRGAVNGDLFGSQPNNGT